MRASSAVFALGGYHCEFLYHVAAKPVAERATGRIMRAYAATFVSAEGVGTWLVVCFWMLDVCRQI